MRIKCKTGKIILRDETDLPRVDQVSLTWYFSLIRKPTSSAQGKCGRSIYLYFNRAFDMMPH